VDRPSEWLDGADDDAVWRAAREVAWAAPGAVLAKVAATPRQLIDLDAALHAAGAQRRYSRAGNLAWVAWPATRPLDELDARLTALGLSGLRLRGGDGPSLLGRTPGGAFGRRVRAVLDPDDRFPVI
jgi:hypothetical protein